MTSAIVFTDLDGTLLDHSSYSYEEALPALDALKQLNIPLILASSKTAAELLSLRSELGFENCPAIVENGAGVLSASSQKASDIGADDYNRLISIISSAPSSLRCHYNGFNDWTIDQISQITNLSKDQAILASQRQFSEPGLWTGEETAKQDFIYYLTEHGVHTRYGGRFMTLSFGATKGQRVSEITKQFGSQTKTLSLGDAPNDIEMLENTDFGVIINNHHGNDIPPLAGEATNRISRTTKQGPAGWNDAVLNFISSQLGFTPQSRPSQNNKSEKDIG
ncbi:HAD-IIB family hydrolase [Hirschia maritima]|uniref:HAD-IIB family hydrolase n=1 Tax=Hirschia maritima TaxID=1121961 RepID=UPI00036A8195|nr:HAD-IIB family hydrolase [Hirschia maritima]